MSVPVRCWSDARYVVVDVEGNGARPPDLVELAAVPILGGVIGRPTCWLVRPETPISYMARRVHGISNNDVADAPPFDKIRHDVLAHLGDAVVVGHNLHIDLAVLRRKIPDWHPDCTIDTLKLARRLLPDQRSHKLGALVDDLGLADGLPPGLNPHRATYDAIVTARLLVRLAGGTEGRATHSYEELCELGGLGRPKPAEPDQQGLFE